MARSLALSFDGTWNTVSDQTNGSRIHAAITSTAGGVGPADVQLEFVRWDVLSGSQEDLLRQGYATAKRYKVEITLAQDFSTSSNTCGRPLVRCTPRLPKNVRPG